jgi:hypothetical protein
MAVEVVAAVVVAPGRAGVGVSGCVLDVLERHAGGEGLGDKGYLPWIRSIACSEGIFGIEAREAGETRGERRGSRSSVVVGFLRLRARPA